MTPIVLKGNIFKIISKRQLQLLCNLVNTVMGPVKGHYASTQRGFGVRVSGLVGWGFG